jgi:alpha-amylase
MPDTNGVLYQAFHFHSPADPPLWTRLEADAHTLKDRGFTAVWIPPCYKGASGPTSTGYDSYDLFDLGEFETPWHGSVREATSTEVKDLRAENSELKEVVAEMTLKNRVLKKSLMGHGDRDDT